MSLRKNVINSFWNRGFIVSVRGFQEEARYKNLDLRKKGNAGKTDSCHPYRDDDEMNYHDTGSSL